MLSSRVWALAVDLSELACSVSALTSERALSASLEFCGTAGFSSVAGFCHLGELTTLNASCITRPPERLFAVLLFSYSPGIAALQSQSRGWAAVIGLVPDTFFVQARRDFNPALSQRLYGLLKMCTDALTLTVIKFDVAALRLMNAAQSATSTRFLSCPQRSLHPSMKRNSSMRRAFDGRNNGVKNNGWKIVPDRCADCGSDRGCVLSLRDDARSGEDR